MYYVQYITVNFIQPTVVGCIDQYHHKHVRNALRYDVTMRQKIFSSITAIQLKLPNCGVCMSYYI